MSVNESGVGLTGVDVSPNIIIYNFLKSSMSDGDSTRSYTRNYNRHSEININNNNSNIFYL